VWRATDQVSGRDVAVKALGAFPAGDQAPWARARLALRVIAGLQTPGVAVVHDYGRVITPGEFGLPYLVRDFVPGQTLEERLGQGPLETTEALKIVASVADALAAVHQAGLVHGNLVPANVVLTAGGVRVTDAGLWVLRDHPAERLFPSAISYAAPERMAGEPATPATDMYSLGVVFAACLTGISAGGSTGPPLLPHLPDDSAAGLASLWAACLGASPRDRPSAAHAAVMSRQLISAAPQSAAWPADGPAAAGISGPAGAIPADAPAAQAPRGAAPGLATGHRRWGRRVRRGAGTGPPPRHDGHLPGTRRGGMLAIGGAATGVTVAVVVVLGQFLASPPAPAGRPAAAPTVAAHGSPAPSDPRTTPRPGASPETTTSVRAARPARRASPVPPLTAVSQLWRTVRHGAVDGQIRQDVAVDFENLIGPARSQLMAGQHVDVTALVAALRGKLAARISEGAITASAARRLGGELTTLARSAQHH
jgi:eukaryotic-like serine/threonine-protein kinase